MRPMPECTCGLDRRAPLAGHTDWCEYARMQLSHDLLKESEADDERRRVRFNDE